MAGLLQQTSTLLSSALDILSGIADTRDMSYTTTNQEDGMSATIERPGIISSVVSHAQQTIRDSGAQGDDQRMSVAVWDAIAADPRISRFHTRIFYNAVYRIVSR